MSDLRIALVAEGHMIDRLTIEASLKAILHPRSFVLTQLQPEATRPDRGTGWGGVLKWCSDAAKRHTGLLESDPTLALFDAVVIHLDADVSSFNYGDLRPAVEPAALAANRWIALPCAFSCPPNDPASDPLREVVCSWLAPVKLGPRAVLCLPAMNTGAWLAAATLPQGHRLLANLECNLEIEVALTQLPLSMRIRKSRVDAIRHSPEVEAKWPLVKERCSRAQAFERDTRVALP